MDMHAPPAPLVTDHRLRLMIFFFLRSAMFMATLDNQIVSTACRQSSASSARWNASAGSDPPICLHLCCHAALRQARRPVRPQIRDDDGGGDLHLGSDRVRSGRVDEHADRCARAARARRRRHHGIDLLHHRRPFRTARTGAIPELFQPRPDGVRRNRSGTRRHDERLVRLAIDFPGQYPDRDDRADRPVHVASLSQADAPAKDRLCRRDICLRPRSPVSCFWPTAPNCSVRYFRFGSVAVIAFGVSAPRLGVRRTACSRSRSCR